MNNRSDFETGVIKPIECYKEAWELIKPHFWLLFAITLVGIMIGGATMYILTGAMICGIMYCFLEAIDGKEPKFENLFKGFSFWKPGLFVFAVMFFPTIFVIALLYLPIIFAALAGEVISQKDLLNYMIGVFVIDFIVMVIMVCVHTLLLFAFPLIIDRQLSGWESIKASVRGVWGNLNGVAGLWGVGFIVSLAGLLLFCVGVYLTIPIIIGAHMVAYRKIFPGPVASLEASV